MAGLEFRISDHAITRMCERHLRVDATAPASRALAQQLLRSALRAPGRSNGPTNVGGRVLALPGDLHCYVNGSTVTTVLPRGVPVAGCNCRNCRRRRRPAA